MTDIRAHQRLLALDGLRFIAAALVAFSHSMTFSLSKSTAWFMPYLVNLSGLGMTLFFVLSGFVIHYHYHLIVTERGKVGILQFLWLRFSRLYPLYIAVIVIDIVTSHQLPKLAGGNLQSWEAFLTHAFMVQTWYYDVIGTNNLIYQFGLAPQVAWSISTEMFFYIFYIPLSFLLIRIAGSRFAITLLAIMVCLAFYWVYVYTTYNMPAVNIWARNMFGPIADPLVVHQDSFARWLTYFSPYARLVEFILGTIAASYFLLVRDSKGVTKGAALQTLLLVCLVLAAQFMVYNSSFYYRKLIVSSVAYSPLVAILIYMLASRSNVISRALSGDLIVKLGQASYSIYLLHLPIINMLKFSATTETFADYALQFLRTGVTLGVVFIVGRGVYLVYELPAQNFLRRHQRRMSQLIVALMVAGIAGFLLISTITSLKATAPNKGITVVSATYGKNCGAPQGNVTAALGDSCNKEMSCHYKVDVNVLGDPAGGCGKDFEVKWLCASSNEPQRFFIEGEAGLGSIAELTCP
jgi:peptidoglycan/LPS O-acetylase OafA/YrhL